MISNTVIAGILIAITACFFTPFVLLAWLMAFRKAKRIVYMLIFGVIARAVTIFAQSFVIYTFDNIKGYDKVPAIIQLGISDTIACIICVAVLCILFSFIKSEGLNYNRVFTIAVGFGSVEVIVGTGISYCLKLINAFEIKAGGIAEKYSESQGERLLKDITSESLTTGLAVAVMVVASMLACALAAMVLLYGMVKNKEKMCACASFAILVIQKFGTDAASKFSGSLFTAIFNMIFICGAVWGLRKLCRMEKALMIKPRSMLLKEQQEQEEKKVIRIEQ